MSLNILFISVDTIKDRTGLHNNVDDKLVKPEIKTAQDIYILPILGSGLYDRLQEGIDDNNLTANEVILLDNYVTDTLVNYVLSELPQGLSFQYYNKGLIKKTGDNFESPSMQDMIDVANKYKARAEFYSERLIKYLKQNHTLYPQYLNYGLGIDSIVPKNSGYKSSLFLYNGSCCTDSLEEKYQANNSNCCNNE